VAGYTISFPMAIKNANAGIGLVAKRGMTQDDADAIWAEHGETSGSSTTWRICAFCSFPPPVSGGF
jgi:LuxR family transcriptional regulator